MKSALTRPAARAAQENEEYTAHHAPRPRAQARVVEDADDQTTDGPSLARARRLPSRRERAMVNMPPDLLARIDRAAALRGWSRSMFFLEAAGAWFEQFDNPEPAPEPAPRAARGRAARPATKTVKKPLNTAARSKAAPLKKPVRRR